MRRSERSDIMPSRDLTLTGDRRLAKKFDNLAGAVQNRIVRRPLSAALTPINRAAKRKAPKLRGFLKKSIGKKVKMYPGGVWGGVGPRTGSEFTYIDENGKKHVPANYAHLPEFGTIHAAAQPYLRPALDEQRTTAFRILQMGIKDNMEKEAAKA